MNNKILTISVAAYNVENTLDKTLASFNDQRVKDDIEVLIIDDGSKDNTKNIALKYETIDPGTFKYVPKNNGGHGSTINKGIELASGKYFKVIDGDDWVDTKALIKFVSLLKDTNSDLILTNHCEVYENKKEKINLVEGMKNGKVYTWDDDFDIKRVVLHTLTIKTELLKKNKVHITENCFYVDVEYVIWAAYLSKTITFFNIYLYMYRMGNANQSVNKKNMLKNVRMQETVSYKLVDLYDKFVSSHLMNSKKEETIFNTFKRSIGSTMRTYLLENSNIAKRNIKGFDNNIKNISNVAYQRLNSDKFIAITRKWNYSLVPLLKVAYGIWVKKYE
ncbi:hypothetical protein B5G22_07130 [Limosilactobacillus reuteri]|uniref:Glycosyltransferase 2-like domain-containing protein n=1 Tax=Limosilactobacillus reuteri TaxID=1598 RepID=A0A1Y3UDL7_LIMRT|nr:glycosyltransferase family A protein [Limosilactobacillus reuteri]OUN46864.1 hypothetical protein B5G22_07130 [Limosilactobacillus reuteri]OUP88454.1 hypothetical protein B5F04_07335 [Limosilactobacillus reuteri]